MYIWYGYLSDSRELYIIDGIIHGGRGITFEIKTKFKSHSHLLKRSSFAVIGHKNKKNNIINIISNDLRSYILPKEYIILFDYNSCQSCILLLCWTAF